MYGKGLNSIRWRFTLVSVAVTTTGMVLRERVLGHDLLGDPSAWASLGGVVALIGVATYALAGRLAGMLSTLQHSAEAVAAGRLDEPIGIDCQCEVGGLAQSFRQMTAQLNANVLRMNTLAYTDAITGLPNRAVVNHLLHYALAPERCADFRAAIVFIDLDGFKRINDTLGHDGGDELLALASHRVLQYGLSRTLETIDRCSDANGNPCERLPQDIVFARFAGDEFVAVVPELTDRALLAEMGQRILDSLQAPFRVKQHDVTVGASIGIAIAPDDTRSPTELLSFADLAMYSAKQAGKGQLQFFDKRVRDAMLRSAEVEADLRLALARDEFVLHFQPKLDTQTLALHGVEALVRWQHPQRGLLAPGAFIEVAEKAGLMVPLGRRVLELAAQQCRAWLEVGIECPVAVNVSPAQFSDPSFVEHALDTLFEIGLPPHLISVEITESMAMSDFDFTAERLAQLRRAGVHVAIDDFGIGFSNLSQLARLPFDELKVDRSLVREIGLNPKTEAIIRAVLGMTQALGYRAIAEGIEMEPQLAFLRELGCDTVQGFLFAKPMSSQALESWMRNHRSMPLPAQALPAPSLLH